MIGQPREQVSTPGFDAVKPADQLWPQHLEGGTDGNDFASSHGDGRGARPHHLIEIVQGQNGHGPRFGDIGAQNLKHLVLAVEIQCRGRLVHQQDLRRDTSVSGKRCAAPTFCPII